MPDWKEVSRRFVTFTAPPAEHLPMLAGISACLHLVTWLPGHLDETAVVKAAYPAGISVNAVGPYQIENDGPGG